MANELTASDLIEGETYYALAFNASEQVWNTDAAAYEAYDENNYADYVIDSQVASGLRRFDGDAPANAVKYEVRLQAGATPDPDDDVDWEGVVALPLNAAGVRTAIGLASADLDAQLDVLGNQLGDLQQTNSDQTSALNTLIAFAAEFTSFDFIDAGVRFINMTEADGPNFRFTTNAVEQAPTGGGGGGGNKTIVQRSRTVVQR